jgi:hypothetical protein
MLTSRYLPPWAAALRPMCDFTNANNRMNVNRTKTIDITAAGGGGFEIIKIDSEKQGCPLIGAVTNALMAVLNR